MANDSTAGSRRPQGRTVKLSSRADQLYDGLRAPFVSPTDLSAMGEFVITSYSKRRNRTFKRDECAYGLTIIETPIDGGPNDRVLTLEANEFRERVGNIFRSLSPGQTLGPLVIMQQPFKDDASQFYWVFGELDDTGVAHPIDDPTASAEPAE